MRTLKIGELFQSRVVAVAPTIEKAHDGRKSQSMAMQSFKAAALESATEMVTRDQACGILFKNGFVLDPDSSLKTLWDVLCTCFNFTSVSRKAKRHSLAVTPVILYTATIMPYNIFFEVEETEAWKAIDLFATCLFLVSVVSASVIFA